MPISGVQSINSTDCAEVLSNVVSLHARNIPHIHVHEKKEKEEEWHGAKIQVVIEGNWTTYRVCSYIVDMYQCQKFSLLLSWQSLVVFVQFTYHQHASLQIEWSKITLLLTLQSKILHYMRQMAVITPYAEFIFKFVSDTSE